MKTNNAPRFLYVFAMTLLAATASPAQPPKKVYSEVDYHKLKPGHCMAEARAIGNEWKKLHQAQANNDFVKEIVKVELWEQLENAPTIRLNARQIDNYVGVYEGPFNVNAKYTFTVTREGNQLFEELTGGTKLEIIPRSETRFAFARMDAELEFIRDASGRVVKRTLIDGGQTSEAKNIK